MSVSRLSQTSVQNALQKYNNVWDGRSAVGAMDPLGSFTFTTATNGITFSSIPQTYLHLQVRFYIVSTGSSMDFSYYLNTVASGTATTFRSLKGDGTTVTSPAYISQPYAYLLKESTEYSGGVPSGSILTGIMDIHDYTSTSKNKSTKVLYGTEQGTAGFVKEYSCSYASTAAVTTLQLFNGYVTWGAGSQFSLYGVK